MTALNAAPEPATTTITLDPFGLWPASASRIDGLGGKTFDPDPAYAFHTNYAEVGSGIVVCTLRFERLQAAMGMITVRVNGLPPGPGARAETIRTWTADLADVSDSDGVLELSFQASSGTRYAVLGHIYEETDARGHGLEVSLELTPDASGFGDASATRKTIFGRRQFRRTAKMVVRNKPTLVDPVSQACTASQFEEPAYRRWVGEFHEDVRRHRKQWEFVYILQTLDRYGLLRPGARGIGFGVGREPLPAVMASHGCTVVASDLDASDPHVKEWNETGQHASTIEALRFPNICADDVFDRQVSFRPVDMNNIDPDLTGFDFTWSSCSLEHLGSIEAGLTFIRNSVNCLTFGGLAVHTTELNVSSNTDTLDNAGTVLFRRQDFERIAVDLVSRGHYVAQLNFDLGDTPIDDYVDVPPYTADPHLKLQLGRYVSTSFGIIVRRGDR